MTTKMVSRSLFTSNSEANRGLHRLQLHSAWH